MVESLCSLVQTVWDKMRLAGEAGSLLKIEAELRDAIQRDRNNGRHVFRCSDSPSMGCRKNRRSGWFGSSLVMWRERE